MEAFAALLRAHAATTRRLSAELAAAHGLTIHDYEVLLHLARAPERRLRRVDLADRVLLTPSGVTRLLDGLERAGLVAREACAADRRVAYAVLTDEGLRRLREAAVGHLAEIEALFGERLDGTEAAELAMLLSRLAGDDVATDCVS